MAIEDNETVCDLLSDIFADNYEVSTARSAKEAMHALEAFVPDLILSDILLPGKNGITLISDIRQSARLRAVPVIFLTGVDDPEMQLAGLKTGAIHYITKPFNVQELRLRVANLLDLQKANKFPEISATPARSEEGQQLLQDVNDLLASVYVNKDLRVEFFSEKLGISLCTLERKFQRASNNTLVNYIREYRLNTARQMIQEGNLRIGEIADRCGFSSLHYFSRSFKSQFGHNPRSIKNKNGQNYSEESINNATINDRNNETFLSISSN